MGKCQGDCGIPQPSLQSEDMPQKPLDVSTPLFYPRAEEQQASLPGEQPRDANAARIHKSVRVCSHMVHQRMRCKKLQRVFYCNLSKKVQSGAPEKAATNVAAFLLHHSLRDGFMLRLRLAFARGDWSLKMAAGLWAGAMIERERKRGANNLGCGGKTAPRNGYSLGRWRDPSFRW